MRLGGCGKAVRVLVAVVGIVPADQRLGARPATTPGRSVRCRSTPPSVPRRRPIDYTRISAQTDAGTTVDVPLNIEGAGVARAEIEARTGEIEKDPSLAAAGRRRLGAEAPRPAAVREARADPRHHPAGQGTGRRTADARGARDLAGTPMRVANWFTPKIALARIAWLRTVLYLFVILDMHAFVRDTRDQGRAPRAVPTAAARPDLRPAEAVGGEHHRPVRRTDRRLPDRRRRTGSRASPAGSSRRRSPGGC